MGVWGGASPHGSAGRERTRTEAAAIEAGSAPSAGGAGSGSPAQSSGPALLGHHLLSRDRSVLQKRPQEPQETKSAPSSQDSAKEAKSRTPARR